LNSSHFEFVSIPAAAERFEAIPVHGEYSRATYMRLMLPQLLPDVKRIIYLDTDTVVNRSIADFFEIDPTEKPIAACVDFGIQQNIELSLATLGFTETTRDQLVRLVLPAHQYSNAGVTVINLDHWRRHDIAGQLERLLLRPPHKFLWQDQDVMNLLFRSGYVALDPRWNCLAVILAADQSEIPPAPGLAEIYRLWAADPWIIHYAGHSKLPTSQASRATAVRASGFV